MLTFWRIRWQLYFFALLDVADFCDIAEFVYLMGVPQVQPHVPCGGTSTVYFCLHTIAFAQLTHSRGIFQGIYFVKKLPHLAFRTARLLCGDCKSLRFLISLHFQLILKLSVRGFNCLIVDKLPGKCHANRLAVTCIGLCCWIR